MRVKSLITLCGILAAASLSVFPSPEASAQGRRAKEKAASGESLAGGPLTFCNPLDLVVGSERARRGGEPVVLIFEDEYYLFVTGSRGYWCSENFRDWTYIDAPTFPGGVVSVVERKGVLYACSMNSFNVFSCKDPKSGKWEQCGTFSSDRYGDANMFVDDDDRLYMVYGWSQLMPFRIVELDPETFKEKGETKVLFFSDYKNHGFERRSNEDVIFSIFANNYRPYYDEEYPWIEGPWITKHNGKYYLQYAAIGLEFTSYSHGVYVADNIMGPYTYSEHNPLTFKTTGYVQGAGHGSTFHDKDGRLWTICMIPAFYGGNGGAELAIYPTAVDEDGVMHSNTAFGDYPQYYPGIRTDDVESNFAGWMLLSRGKKVEVSSTLGDNVASNAVDENFMTNWFAETGNPGEYLTVDLGTECEINAVQVNFDRADATVRVGRGAPRPADDVAELTRYQCYTVEVSDDNENWTVIIDKSENTQDRRHDYTELSEPVMARYVKVTNVFTHDNAKFGIKDLRVFGNADKAKFTEVTDFKAVRNPEDRRMADLLWTPVPEADGYVVRYGIEPDKLYNSYVVYDDNKLSIKSLNTRPDYYYEITAFDSGTGYYRPVTEEINGTGAEIELSKGSRSGGWGGGANTTRLMTYQGVEEYVFDNIDPGTYTLRHSYGPVLWSGELTEAELIGTSDKPTVTAFLTYLGTGTEVRGKMEMKVVPGREHGKIVVTMTYDK